MPFWKHKLKIKDIFMDYEGTPSAEETTDMAKRIITELYKLIASITDDDDLVYELETVIGEFEVIDENDSEDDAQGQFNFALNELYSLGDFDHRVWIG